MQLINRKLKDSQPALVDDDTEIDELVHYVEHLMRWYSVRRSLYLANNIVNKLEMINERVEECSDAARSFRCERLIKKWRHLARGRVYSMVTKS